MKILVPLAEGFEEIEAVTIIDILRRAGIETVTASLHSPVVTGSHGIPITADNVLSNKEKYDGIVLPGGIPGSTNLKKDPGIINLIKTINKSGGITAAICAAPIVLAEAGLLKGKMFTCYPGYENEIEGGIFTSEPVTVDGNIITGKGAACTLPFALRLVEIIKGGATAEKLKEQMMAFW